MTRKSLLLVAAVGFAAVGITASSAAPIAPISALAGLSTAHKAQLICPATGNRCYWTFRKFRHRRDSAYGYGPSYGYGYGPTFGFASTW